MLCSALTGCFAGAQRPDLGYVSGTVKFNGEPVKNINVVMKPLEGRAAMGVTDDEGHYEIEYTQDEKGTKVGPNTVSLEWPQGFTPTFPLSERYRTDKTTLKFDVKPGDNTYDIPLEPESAAETARRKKQGDFIVD
ncbi:MAG: hypothetical protein U0992_17860 [Planctomycetaceae bacterium]